MPCMARMVSHWSVNDKNKKTDSWSKNLKNVHVEFGLQVSANFLIFGCHGF